MKWKLAVILLICLNGCQAMQSADNPVVEFYNILSGNTAGKAARQMEDPYFADERRDAINYLVARRYGKHDPYTKRYSQIAVNDEDHLVRATAIRALNRARYAEASNVFVNALADENALVRLEGAKALANMPDPAAVAPLLRLLQDEQEDRDVRIAAADALRHYKNLETARTLVNMLSERNFGVAWQSRRSLVALTGHDMGYDESQWLLFLTGQENPFG